MSILKNGMKKLIELYRIGPIAHIYDNKELGSPSKGIAVALDNDDILLCVVKTTDVHSNLKYSSELVVYIEDELSGKGYRFNGEARYLHRGSAAFNQFYHRAEEFIEWRGLEKDQIPVIIVLSLKSAIATSELLDEANKSADYRPVDFELIGYKMCPFVQRTQIVLLHKQVKYRTRYVDLAQPPEWFIDISPNKKVPLLIVDGNSVIYESAIINELIDELTPNKLHPENPLKRAYNKSWIEFSSDCLMDTLYLTTVETKEEFNEILNASRAKLETLEAELTKGTFFNGQNFSLVDAAFAPLFIRLAMIDRLLPINDSHKLPKLARWRQQLLAIPAVKNSIVDDFEVLYEAEIWKRQGYLSQFLSGANSMAPPKSIGRY